MKLAGVAALSLVLGWAAARLIARFGIRWGLADVPNERSSHSSITPKGGGLGIPLAVAFTGIFFAPSQLFIAGISSAIAAMALLNDRREYPAGFRLLIEALAACGVISALLVQRGAVVNLSVALLVVPASVVYVVAQANFFNFMDGIDGIAAIEAVVSFSLLGAWTHLYGNPDLLPVAIAVVAGALGFLPANFPTAKVFMGDVGSVFLGFVFASLTLAAAGSWSDFPSLVLFQGVFFVDCFVTIIRRALWGENLLSPHRRHLYQRLVHRRGWSHARTALVFGGAQAVFGLAALALHSAPLGVRMLPWFGLLFAYLIGDSWCGRSVLLSNATGRTAGPTTGC